MTKVIKGEPGYLDYKKKAEIIRTVIYFALVEMCIRDRRHYGLRVNTNKISVEQFLKIAPWPLEPIPWISNGFYYDGEQVQPAKHPYYFAGLYRCV